MSKILYLQLEVRNSFKTPLEVRCSRLPTKPIHLNVADALLNHLTETNKNIMEKHTKNCNISVIYSSHLCKDCTLGISQMQIEDYTTEQMYKKKI